LPAAFQLFEEALKAKLNATLGLTALLGVIPGGAPAIFVAAVPQTYDFGRNGAALTYLVPTKPRGHVLTGSDGTAVARVQFDAWGYQEGIVRQIIEAIRQAIDGVPVNPWGTGYVNIVSVVQQNDLDLDEPPKAGTDQWVYRTMSEYNVMYRTGLPTLN
jgi:hypothetical protein